MRRKSLIEKYYESFKYVCGYDGQRFQENAILCNYYIDYPNCKILWNVVKAAELSQMNLNMILYM